MLHCPCLLEQQLSATRLTLAMPKFDSKNSKEKQNKTIRHVTLVTRSRQSSDLHDCYVILAFSQETGKNIHKHISTNGKPLEKALAYIADCIARALASTASFSCPFSEPYFWALLFFFQPPLFPCLTVLSRKSQKFPIYVYLKEGFLNP